jgi:hypothetical protein
MNRLIETCTAHTRITFFNSFVLEKSSSVIRPVEKTASEHLRLSNQTEAM